jgi:hypothetical protein
VDASCPENSENFPRRRKSVSEIVAGTREARTELLAKILAGSFFYVLMVGPLAGS